LRLNIHRIIHYILQIIRIPYGEMYFRKGLESLSRGLESLSRGLESLKKFAIFVHK
jgi:hypothetical protein